MLRAEVMCQMSTDIPPDLPPDDPPKVPIDLPYPLLSLTNDVVLKIFFAARERRHLLMDFANTLLQLDGLIVSLEVINSAVTPEMIQQKGVILDIAALTAAKEHLQIEMQVRSHPYFLERAFFYASKLHSRQLVRGQRYDELRPSYCINILNFNQFDGKDPDRYRRVLTVLDRDTAEDFGTFLELHFYELLKFSKFMKKNPQGSGSPHLDNWLQLLKNPADKRMERAMRTDPVIKDAMQHLIEISGDMQVQELARMREVAEHEWASMIGTAEDKGRAEGEAKGRAEGRAEGRSEGRSEGEVLAKERILMSLLSAEATASLPNRALADLVGLPVERVAAMRKNLQR